LHKGNGDSAMLMRDLWTRKIWKGHGGQRSRVTIARARPCYYPIDGRPTGPA